MKISHYRFTACRGGDRRIASGSPLFHVAARRDVNCPVIRGEFHRGTSKTNETAGKGGRGAWKSGNRKRERRSPSDDEWRSDGSFACKTKIQVERARKSTERKTAAARTGWKIRGCLRFVIYKRPFQETSFSFSANHSPLLPCPPSRFFSFVRFTSPLPLVAPVRFSFVYNHRHNGQLPGQKRGEERGGKSKGDLGSCGHDLFLSLLYGPGQNRTSILSRSASCERCVLSLGLSFLCGGNL